MTVQYLIDSENVGDFWIPLLDLPGQDTELIVFYTRNSPHMSYDSLIRLKESDRTVTFIKCYEGTNALDFQLVSELGYRISKDEEGSFIIVTNDTGFDAAVKYWKCRKKSVKRITGKECKNIERRLREDLSIGIPQSHSVNVSSRLITLEENEEEQDVHAEMILTDAEADQEARPSRPNLRDAERAAQPDPDESYSADSEYMSDVDFDDDEEENADSDAFDLFVEDMDYPSDENEEDDSQDEDAFDIGTSETGQEIPEIYPAEEDVDAVKDKVTSLEETENVPDADAGEETDPAQYGVFTSEDAAEETVSENEAGLTGNDQHGNADGPQSDDEMDPAVRNDAVKAEEESPAQEAEIPEIISAEQSDDSEDKNSEPSPSQESTLSSAVNTPAELQETSESGTDSSSSEEDSVSETAPRSKSRRSRSRRSKSTARKQEQAADDAQTRETSVPAVTVSAAGNDGRKDESPKEDTDAVRQKSADALPEPGDEEIARIVACIGAENLAELHNQLATFYGEQGKDIYLSIKNNTRSLPVLKPDLKQKFEYYCEIIFYRSDYSGEYPSDISEYLLNVREKLNNLNSLRYALQKHYGKEKGRRFYFLLKPFAKTMYQM